MRGNCFQDSFQSCKDAYKQSHKATEHGISTALTRWRQSCSVQRRACNIIRSAGVSPAGWAGKMPAIRLILIQARREISNAGTSRLLSFLPSEDR